MHEHKCFLEDSKSVSREREREGNLCSGKVLCPEQRTLRFFKKQICFVLKFDAEKTVLYYYFSGINSVVIEATYCGRCCLSNRWNFCLSVTRIDELPAES